MADGRVARVYASALFEAATEAASVARTRDDLHAFDAALTESRPLANVVLNPRVEPAVKRRVLRELTTEADHLAAGTLSVLLDKGRIGLLGEVVGEYDRLAADAAGAVDLELTTALPVAQDLEQRIVTRVEELTDRRALVSRQVDPQIIGGMVLRVGDVIIDGSLRSRIRQLRKRLQSAEVRGGDQ